ncbi:gluconate 2-dehydrogenase subunit 3 family protein [Dyella japonica]|uniref:Twin-arginine translocation pathway signal n=1 Tax=Dyella japonica A8 TaxID=1217721 RepID=A0A075K7W6_9GAMM|nr:gluconate 2-dehydrogenase subunit 3 family protein [Dyella japonica]AIF48248.1 twin-arginine translocation pathway signal [Dyella japonica A8]
MNRREWLKCVSTLAMGAVAAPSLLAISDAYAAAQAPGFAPQFFSKAQIDVVSAVVDIIIPRGGTPGAIDAGVPAFIDQMFTSVYTKAEQARYLSALASFERAGARPFLQLDEAQRKALVTKLHGAALSTGKGDTPEPAADFVLMTKRLTMTGFFLSEPGCTQVLQYAAVPGAYQADVPLAKAGNGKAWAVETALAL